MPRIINQLTKKKKEDNTVYDQPQNRKVCSSLLLFTALVTIVESEVCTERSDEGETSQQVTVILNKTFLSYVALISTK